ncbi:MULTISPECIES: phenylacetate--CoA ligase family protein [Agrobacterium]|uniref:hypothetical protein n=1 Tax=Agrobacterium TaxID=357 RepID=UPI0015733F76|nr:MULTISPECIES: hypothetical protein [Agrobacterium]NTJ44146.1 hypothetical protein [Agrobacterium larrymoorei]WCK22401.1 hypothetical protein G6M09_025650 [Agrobacterium tumefaciens]
MLTITENYDDAVQKVLSLTEKFNLPALKSKAILSSANQLSEIIDQLPVSTKQSLIDYRNSNSKAYLSEALLFAETSGTTGAPLQIPRTRLDLANGVRNYTEAYKTVVRPGEDRVAFIHPSILSPLRDLTVRSLQDLGVGIMTLFPIPGLCSFQRIHHVLSQNEVTTLLTSPSIVYQLLFNFSKLGLQFPLSINKVLVTGEYFSRSIADNIRRLIGRECHIAPIIYGANEIGMMMYGDDRFTYRGVTRDFVFECLPLENPDLYTSFVPDGVQIGELLVTGLTPTIMPVIRYATRDVFNFVPDQDGGCRFEHLGRKDDYPVNLRQRNSVDDVLYSLSEPIFHHQLILNKRSSIATIQILSRGTISAKEQTEVVDRLREILGDSIKVTLETQNYDGDFVDSECVAKINRFILAA